MAPNKKKNKNASTRAKEKVLECIYYFSKEKVLYINTCIIYKGGDLTVYADFASKYSFKN